MTAPHSLAWDVTSESDPDACEAYRDSFEGLYEVDELDLGPRRIFYNRTRMTLFKGGAIGQGRSNSQTLRRPALKARRAGYEAISLIVANSPVAGSADDRSFACEAGSVIFVDLGRPSQSRWQNLDVINLVVPRALMPRSLAEAELHGLTLAARSPAARLIASHLRTLCELAPELSEDEGEAAIGAALTIAQAALGAGPAVAGRDQSAAIHRTVRERAARYIETRLLDPELNVDEIARACAVSRTTLYRAFDAEAGLKRYIQCRRLDRARDALGRRILGRPSVADIAHDHGFCSPSHFSRAFRERFGVSPSDVAPAGWHAERPAEADVIGLGAVVDWLKGGAAR